MAQELWEALPLKERLSYKFLISKLDVSQIIALYDDKYLDLFNQRSFFDREWLSEDRTVMSVPWPNIVEVGIMYIANTPVASLNEINLLTLGKFIHDPLSTSVGRDSLLSLHLKGSPIGREDFYPFPPPHTLSGCRHLQQGHRVSRGLQGQQTSCCS